MPTPRWLTFWNLRLRSSYWNHAPQSKCEHSRTTDKTNSLYRNGNCEKKTTKWKYLEWNNKTTKQTFLLERLSSWMDMVEENQWPRHKAKLTVWCKVVGGINDRVLGLRGQWPEAKHSFHCSPKRKDWYVKYILRKCNFFHIWWREYSYSSAELSKPEHIKLKEKHTMYVIIKSPKTKYKFSKATRQHSTMAH